MSKPAEEKSKRGLRKRCRVYRREVREEFTEEMSGLYKRSQGGVYGRDVGFI
jgi:hypothetical protein